MLVDTLINDFQDLNNGGFYFTSKDHEKLIYRPKSYMDESLPSGNSVAIDVLMEIYELTGESKYISAVENALKSAHDSLTRSSFHIAVCFCSAKNKSF